MKRGLLYFLPLAVFLGFAAVAYKQLGENPNLLPSNLIDRPVPAFALAALPGRDRPLTSETLKGEVSLVSIFGSWCVACIEEHPTLNAINAEGLVKIHGIAWREKDPMDAVRWLKRHGDPYDHAGLDPDSRVAIDFGVTGAPETFVVDAEGVIRYKHTGIVTPEVWKNTLKPLVLDLKTPAASSSGDLPQS